MATRGVAPKTAVLGETVTGVTLHYLKSGVTAQKQKRRPLIVFRQKRSRLVVSEHVGMILCCLPHPRRFCDTVEPYLSLIRATTPTPSPVLWGDTLALLRCKASSPILMTNFYLGHLFHTLVLRREGYEASPNYVLALNQNDGRNLWRSGRSKSAPPNDPRRYTVWGILSGLLSSRPYLPRDLEDIARRGVKVRLTFGYVDPKD